MDDLQQQLICDHYRIKHVLRLVQRELEKTAELPIDEINLCKITMGLAYLAGYPERYHHPLEEKIIAKIREKADFSAFDRINAQHKYLETETAHLSEMIEHIGELSDLELKRLINQFKRYVIIQNEHLELEEEIVMPAMLKYLAQSDAAELRAEFTNIDDPLAVFESRSLYRDVKDRGAKSKPQLVA